MSDSHLSASGDPSGAAAEESRLIQSLLNQLSEGSALEIQGEYYRNLVRELQASLSQLRKLQHVLTHGLKHPEGQSDFRHIKIKKSSSSSSPLSHPITASTSGTIKIRRRE